MVRPKFLVRLLSALSMAMVMALAFGVFAVSSVGAQAIQQASGGKSMPRTIQFHHTFTPAQLAQSGLTTFTRHPTTDKAGQGTFLPALVPGISVLKQKLPTLWTNSCFYATTGGPPLSVIRQYIEQPKHV
jgi:hypothetical protein